MSLKNISLLCCMFIVIILCIYEAFLMFVCLSRVDYANLSWTCAQFLPPVTRQYSGKVIFYNISVSLG